MVGDHNNLLSLRKMLTESGVQEGKIHSLDSFTPLTLSAQWLGVKGEKKEVLPKTLLIHPNTSPGLWSERGKDCGDLGVIHLNLFMP